MESCAVTNTMGSCQGLLWTHWLLCCSYQVWNYWRIQFNKV